MNVRALGTVVFLFLSSFQAFAQWNCSQPAYGSEISGGTINIQIGSGWSGSAAASAVIGDAINYWHGACNDPGVTYPYLCIGCNSSAYPVVVSYVNGASPSGRCGVHTATLYGGLPIHSDIVIYSSAGGFTCEPVSDSLAHEFGHALGLADVSANANCYGSIMGARNVGGTRSVTSSDCAIASSSWETTTETRIQQCQATCATSCDAAGYCYNNGNVEYYGTPILLDLDDDGFALAGRDSMVSFDLNADGAGDRITWTAVGTRDAFLVLDLNGNGRIDNGGELFGDSTLLPDGDRAPNGYLALAQYDHPGSGGNDDSEISAEDAIYAFLQVWVDANHDGISQPSELSGLSHPGVESVETKYTLSMRTDAHGNLFRFKAKAQIRDKKGRVHSANTYDVFFLK